jgi:amidase
MAAFTEYTHYDGLGLAALVHDRQVTPLELVDAAIERIEQLNPPLNAVIARMYEQARSAAARCNLTAPFAGVPMLLKDFWSMYSGVPTSSGNAQLRHLPRRSTSELVTRWQAAGAIILGKTNTSEFAYMATTEPEAFGPTRNPWDLTRTPAGSSGGSAAAVAVRMVPFAGATDGGGSIRMPASACGLFGLKVSRGRTPAGPEHIMWNGLGVEHVITRSVRDSAAMLDATAGVDSGAPYSAPPPLRPFLAEVTTEPGRLRIAFTVQPFFGGSVDDECLRGVYATVNLLKELGHEVIEDGPTIEAEARGLDLMTLVAAEIRADLMETAHLLGRPVRRDDVEVATYALGLYGAVVSAEQYVQAWRRLGRMARDVGRFCERYDVLLTPTLARPPLPIGHFALTPIERRALAGINRLGAGWLLHRMGIIKPLAAKAYDFMAFTPLFNITGQPAMSVPLHWSTSGLPIGMQFAAPYGDEATLFRLAGQLERAQPWAQRCPPGYEAGAR